MKLKSLLLTMGIISGVAYANIPGTAPYKNIATISKFRSPNSGSGLILVDAKGVIYTTSDGYTWNSAGQFSTTNSAQYYAYSDKSGNAWMYRKKGSEAWKYKVSDGQVTPSSNVFHFEMGRSISVIGDARGSDQIQYALSRRDFDSTGAKIYYRTNLSPTWTQDTNVPSFFDSRYMAFGSNGNFMVLGKNQTELYNLAGTVSNGSYPGICYDYAPRFLGGALDTGYYLICGRGSDAFLSFYDPIENRWAYVFQFNASASGNDNSKYSYVMATYPLHLIGTYAIFDGVYNRWLIIMNPVVSIILENYSGSTNSVPNYGLLCLSRLGLTRSTLYCSQNFLVPSSSNNSQVYAGSIFNKGTRSAPKLHAIFVGNSKNGNVLDIPINMDRSTTNRTLRVSINPGEITWH